MQTLTDFHDIDEYFEHVSDFNNDPVQIPVSYILDRTVSSCDFGRVSDFADHVDFWTTVINDKASDSGFGHLVDSILTEGWEQDSAVGFDGESITEGHHRLVAAILLGMDLVPVTPYGYSPGTICAHWADEDTGILL